MKRLRKGLALIALLLATPAAAGNVAEPEGFRGPPYRAPVPATLSGATVVTAQQAHALWQEGTVAFIDVLPRPPRPGNLPEDTIWRPKPRHSIPGATWLPNVGYEVIAAETDAYFRAGLAAATGGDRAHPVLFFCLAECWMSWNAGKRALGYGYSSVYWYPEGTDGWMAEGLPTELADPAGFE
ncbi:rhodanese [Maritimibacter sp. 55A14]|uniref:PQQ-dependent catabolism-associated CXXCW motif protein n=1 Tax=Maritimibacter sp. 55A14 TaxID=2174844 RepID=UPI000D605F9C|nr:PQQ-dependent catabolism-associated CXXCW motif protein [Maritimibacter sp. 55A14]PWE32545.1 rhodanese [Maritimibacter sp. 55A14]